MRQCFRRQSTATHPHRHFQGLHPVECKISRHIFYFLELGSRCQVLYTSLAFDQASDPNDSLNAITCWRCSPVCRSPRSPRRPFSKRVAGFMPRPTPGGVPVGASVARRRGHELADLTDHFGGRAGGFWFQTDSPLLATGGGADRLPARLCRCAERRPQWPI